MPVLRWFLSGCPDFGNGLEGDGEGEKRSPGTISIAGVAGQPGCVRVVLRDPSNGVVSIRTYTGPFEDLLSTLAFALEEGGVDWTVDKFARRR